MGIFSCGVGIMALPGISHHTQSTNGEFILKDDSALSALTEGAKHKLEDWLALELTAERMAEDELLLVRNYVAGDFQELVEDFKGSWWDSPTMNFLLQAADPTQVDWQLHHWWDGNGPDLH